MPKYHRADLQGLRALAVVAVILDHLVGWPSGGFVGVDIFFVLSGFLITGLLLREHAKSGRISFVGFYRRRIKRIMPAALLVIAVTIAMTFLLFGGNRGVNTLWDGVWATFFVANWNFAAQGTDYFQLGGPISPLQHYWSLAVEEQFYFVWPWLMVLIYWVVGRRGNTSENAGRRFVGFAIIVITALSFTWAVWETLNNPALAYFSTFSRVWELGIGAIIAVFASSFSRIPSVIRTALGTVGLVGIVVSLFLVNDEVAFPAPWAAMPVFFAALVIVAGTGRDQITMWPITNRVSSYIGDISYSLYLWHFPVLILLLAFFARDNGWYYVLALILTAALSVASYHLVENPVRRSQWLEPKMPNSGARRAPRTIDPKVAIGWLAVLSVVAGSLTFVALQPPKVTEASDSLIAQLDTPGSSTLANSDELLKCLGVAAWDTEANCDRDLGQVVIPVASYLSGDTGNSYDCFPTEDQPMKSCVYGLTDGAVRVALVGDSHAASLLPGLAIQAAPMGWRLDTYVGAGCIWMESESCAGMPEIKQELLNGSYDIVLVSAYRGSGSTDKAALAADVARAWEPVADSGAQIVVIEDAPIGVGDAVDCATRVTFDVTRDVCAISVDAGYQVEDALANATELEERAVLIDTEAYFCNASECPAVIGNVFVYRDDISHISASYSKSLGGYLAADIATATGMEPQSPQ